MDNDDFACAQCEDIRPHVHGTKLSEESPYEVARRAAHDELVSTALQLFVVGALIYVGVSVVDALIDGRVAALKSAAEGAVST